MKVVIRFVDRLDIVDLELYDDGTINVGSDNGEYHYDLELDKDQTKELYEQLKEFYGE